MAKKFVRGVTGVDDIEKLDKSLTNVNDLISDGQNTYVHTKKGKTESYYNLTDGVKSIKSTGNTINVVKSDDGTVNLNTDPEKVLEHDNLIAGDNLTKTYSNNKTTLKIDDSFTQRLTTAENKMTGLQNKISTNNSICIYNDSTLRQLFYDGNSYNVNNCSLKIYLKYIAPTVNIYLNKKQFDLVLKMNKGVQSVNFSLNQDDVSLFTLLIARHGSNNTVRINGCVLTLSGSTLTVSTTNNTEQNYVTSFREII